LYGHGTNTAGPGDDKNAFAVVSAYFGEETNRSNNASQAVIEVKGIATASSGERFFGAKAAFIGSSILNPSIY
jgi:hypothetical protein